MSDRPTLAVTGSTGALGGLVAADLAGRGIPQRLLARTPSNAPDLTNAVVVQGDYSDAAEFLEGVTTLLMVSASESADRLDQHRAFVDAAAAAGVEHVVYTSFYGAAADCTFTLGRDHFATEQHLRDSGMAFTFLRDNFYLDFLPLLAGEDGVIRGPAGDGRVAAVARADVARSIVAVLLDPQAHAGRTHDLCGPQALTMTEVAQAVGAATGREVTFHDEGLEEAYASRAGYDAPSWQQDAWVSTYTAIAAGELDGQSDAVHRLTGRPPTSLADLLASPPT